MQDVEEMFFINGGLVDVQPVSVTILADTAVRARDLDEARAQQAMERATRSREAAMNRAEIAVIEAEIAALAAELAAIRKYRQGRAR